MHRRNHGVVVLLPRALLQAADLVDLLHVVEHRLPLIPNRGSVGDLRGLRGRVERRVEAHSQVIQHAVGVAVGVDLHALIWRKLARDVRRADLLQRQIVTSQRPRVALAARAVEEVERPPRFPVLGDRAAVRGLMAGVLARPRARSKHRRGVAAVRRRPQRRRRPDRVTQVSERAVRQDALSQQEREAPALPAAQLRRVDGRAVDVRVWDHGVHSQHLWVSRTWERGVVRLRHCAISSAEKRLNSLARSPPVWWVRTRRAPRRRVGTQRRERRRSA